MPEEINIPQEQPFPLNEKQRWLCKHLDSLNLIQNFCPYAKPSDLLYSALHLSKTKPRTLNPDWMAHAAHSLREIMYNIGPYQKTQDRDGTRRALIEKIFKVYQEEEKISAFAYSLNSLHIIFTRIAHHAQEHKDRDDTVKKLAHLGILPVAQGPLITDAIFEQLIALLENIWAESLPQQISIHKKVDTLLAGRPEDLDKNELIVLLDLNPDAKLYFYAKADVSWLDWLWTNGFLDGIKAKRPEIGRSPELAYLVSLSEKAPNRAVDIMLAIPIAPQSYSPDVLERFLWICRTLPAAELARIIPKICQENWIPLLGGGNRWFEYEKVFKTLFEAKDFKNVLLLAKSLLTIRERTELEQKASSYKHETPFCFADLAETKVFEYLARLDPKLAKETLGLSLETLAQVVGLSRTTGDTSPFIKNERFPFYDVDFFTLEPGKHKIPSYREEVTELAALLKVLTDRSMSVADTPEAKQAIYAQIASLPESVVTWRFRFYTLTLAADALKPQIKEALFKIFDSEEYYNHLTLGAEYEKLLLAGFQYLPDADKRLYVQNCLTSCKPEKHGSPIFTMIWPHLTEEDRNKAVAANFTPLPDYKPHPSIGESRGGWVSPKAPISEDEFGRLPIVEIAKRLRTDWIPDKLKALRKDADYLTPINPEGIGEALKLDFLKRPQEYLDNAQLFFDRAEVSPHYTYAFFRAISDGFQKDATNPGKLQWDNLISLFLAIKKSAEEKPLEPSDGTRDSFDWEAGWNPVHAALTDITKALLYPKNGKYRIEFATFRLQLLEILSYLLNDPDPEVKDEEAETAKLKSKSPGDNEYLISDPLTTAINSVRGRAFEGLVDFARLDWGTFPAEAKIKIAPDVKQLYSDILVKENTRALMCMYGHHLSLFYYGDKDWITAILPKIFPTDEGKKHLYLAAWEGYLANNLSGDMFCDDNFQELYRRGLTIKGNEDPGRKFFKDPEEGIAVHLALAYAHYDEFGLDHSLFKDFWAKGDSAQQSKFIGFIGSHIFRKNKDGKEFIRDNPKTLEKIKSLWDWLLKNHENPEPFKKFGTWVHHEELFFDPVWLASHLKDTITKSGGILEWDYELSQALPFLAKEAPTDTIHIAKLFYLDGVKGDNDRRHFLHWDDKCQKTLTNLYACHSTRSETTDLINALVKQGFWKLKDIVKENNS